MKIHLCMQNIWFTDADISPYGVVNDVVSVNGSAFLAANYVELDGDEENTTPEEEEAELLEFLGATEEEIETRLNNYIGNNPDLANLGQGSIVIIDIEDPVHLNGLHMRSESEQLEVIEGFKKRIRVARKAWPQAKLGLYGALVPDGRGRADDLTYIAREAALIKAGARGLYDGIDYLVPVLYVRYGCNQGGPCDNVWKSIGAYTQLGIDGSKKLLKSDGSPIPLLPLLNFTVNNGNSDFHRVLVMDFGVPDPLGETLKWQLNILERNGVEDVAFWVGGKNSNLINLKDTPNPNKRTITGYLHALFGNRNYKCCFSLKP